MRRSFFVNYGAGSHRFLSSHHSDSDRVNSAYSGNKTTAIKDCENFYCYVRDRKVYQPSSCTYVVNGCDVTVYAFGIHRAVEVALRHDATSAQTDAYQNAQSGAQNFNNSEYELFNNNCVTAVSNVLHALDPNFMPQPKVIIPTSLDVRLRYNYQVEGYADLETARTALSIQDYETFEKTVSSLRKHGWVTRDDNGLLQPTAKAPKQFQQDLRDYNWNYSNVQSLKEQYRAAGGNAHIGKQLFSGNPRYEDVIGAMQQKALRWPNGPSATVLVMHKLQHQNNAEISPELWTKKDILRQIDRYLVHTQETEKNDHLRNKKVDAANRLSQEIEKAPSLDRIRECLVNAQKALPAFFSGLVVQEEALLLMSCLKRVADLESIAANKLKTEIANDIIAYIRSLQKGHIAPVSQNNSAQKIVVAAELRSKIQKCETRAELLKCLDTQRGTLERVTAIDTKHEIALLDKSIEAVKTSLAASRNALIPPSEQVVKPPSFTMRR